MAYIKSLVVLLAAFSVASSRHTFQHAKLQLPRLLKSEANINDYFDEITPQIKEFFIVEGLDPLALPDIVESFNVTDLIGIQWHGELGLQTGWLTDLSLFQRSGDAIATYDDLELNISISLAFPDVAISYDYMAQIMDIGPSGALHGKAENLVVHIEAGAKLSEMKLSLYDFKYVDYGKVTLHIEGSGLDFIENAILDVVTTLFRGPIMDFVESALENVISKLLESIDLGTIIGGGSSRCGGL